MSDTILSGDFTIYYLAENRRKTVKWSGTATGTRTMNQLYSALVDLFDEPTQMDDGVPMSAQTPVEYTIGKIDAGDNDPWYIPYETMQHLTGGALKTSGWARVVTSNTGIVVVPVTSASNTIVTGDIGYDITHADLDAGTLLDIIDLGTATDYLVIRPDSNASANNFDSTSGNLTCNGHTAPQNATSTTGEQIWPNLYSLGTIESDTHIYVYQGAIASNNKDRIYSIIDQTQDWWSDGHLDRCFYIKDFKTATFPTVDGGYFTVFARKYGTKYDSYEVAASITSGGRNPIPLATEPDLDNVTGYKSITFTAASGTWVVGNEFQGNTSGARAIVTQIDNPGATQIVYYYLIDDPQTDFQTASETLTNNDTAGTGTKNGSAPADQGPALSTWFTNDIIPTVAFGNTTADINNDEVNEGYGIILNCQSNPLDEVYEWSKYKFRRGNTALVNNVEAEQYIGCEVYLKYTGSVTGTIVEGSDVTQTTTNATGIVVSHDTALKQILLRNTRGSFATGYVLTDNDTSGYVTINDTATSFSPKKQAPLGTYAGGTFFGARGVLVSNWVTADENKFQLTDSAGVVRERPVAISLAVTNLVGDTEIATDSEYFD